MQLHDNNYQLNKFLKMIVINCVIKEYEFFAFSKSQDIPFNKYTPIPVITVNY